MNGNDSNVAIATVLPSYLTLETVTNVMVSVPVGKYMRWMDELTPDGKPSVPAHWQNGTIVQSDPSIIINRHFFIDDNFLGETICAQVEVVEKTLPDGRKFILLNIRHCEPDHNAPFFKIKFPKGETDQGINIPKTKHEILFKNTPPPE